MPHNLRGNDNFVLPRARINLYGIDTIRYTGKKIWQTLLVEIKVKESKLLEISTEMSN